MDAALPERLQRELAPEEAARLARECLLKR